MKGDRSIHIHSHTLYPSSGTEHTEQLGREESGRGHLTQFSTFAFKSRLLCIILAKAKPKHFAAPTACPPRAPWKIALIQNPDTGKIISHIYQKGVRRSRYQINILTTCNIMFCFDVKSIYWLHHATLT